MLRPAAVLGSALAHGRHLAMAVLVALVAALDVSTACAAETLVVPSNLRLLVVAPHPDDESLGAGGLMPRVLAAGGRVHVLFLTNGDGYPEAVEAATGQRAPSPRDYRGVGELRRAEALVALAHYRVLPRAVTFLGFPDGGLAEIWRRGPRAPAYESPYTRARRSSSPHGFAAGARYVRRDLVHLIARLVARFDPDWIVLPTPRDHHSDHCAAFGFVLAALASLPGEAGTMPDRLLTYLVHTAQGWPPPSEQPGPLPEPAALVAPARWFSLPLDEAQTRTKLEALETHRTQVAVMAELFRSFARPNELFAVLERAEFAGLVPGTPACGQAAHPVPTPPGARRASVPPSRRAH